MVGVCFKYNPGYKSLLRDQYYELLKAFPGVVAYEREINAKEPDNYNDEIVNKVTNADDLPEEPILVVISAQDSPNIAGTTDLKDYTHPSSAIYFFGSNQGDLSQSDIGVIVNYDKVYINISHNTWAAQAMAMVLFDRQSKL